MDELKRRRKPYTADAPKKRSQFVKNTEEPLATRDNKPVEKVILKVLPYTLKELRLVPRPDEYLQRLAHEMVEWSQNDDAIKLSQFFSERYVVRDVWSDWMRRCPELADAAEIAKANIGLRRERKALNGEFNASIVMTTMPLHCPEYKEWRQSLKPKEEQQRGDIRVFIEPYRIEQKSGPIELPQAKEEGDTRGTPEHQGEEIL